MYIKRACPVCHSSPDNASVFMDDNIDSSKISRFSFASRKTPEWMCHQLLRCNFCSLVYVPEPPSIDELAQAYHEAAYDSSEDANDAARSYLAAINPILMGLAKKGSALEIGTGTGIFLEHLLNAGFEEVIGIEPSMAAIQAAPKERQAFIQNGIFREENFTPESFDLICCFMTLEHVQNPMVLTQSAYRLLRKGGAFVSVTHDYQSLVNRTLGKRSPIIDIEHMQLFSKKSIKSLFEIAKLEDVKVFNFVNCYSLRYWLRLSPIPKALKSILHHIFLSYPLKSIRLSINVGNILTVGFKR
jgi:SAM-dependent methyltransferase